MPAESVDLWWSLVLGGSSSGTSDPVVFTPLTGPSANAQWLAQRFLTAVFTVGGLGLLLVIRGLVLTFTVALGEAFALGCGATSQQAGRAGWFALPLLLAGAAVRPQLFALPLFGVVLLLGGPLAGRPGVRVATAAVTALWANLHGSFILAPLCLLLLAGGSPRGLAAERLRLAGISAASTLVNPWGAGLLIATLQVILANEAGGIGGLAVEWRRLDLASPYGGFFLVLAAAASLGLARTGRRQGAHLATLALPLAMLSLAGARHVTWFGLAAMPLAARGLGPTGQVTAGKLVLNSLLLSMLGLFAVIGLARPVVGGYRQLAIDTPVELADRLVEFEHERIFGYSDWGGFLAWQLRPAGRVFVDDRFEQHPSEVWSAYRQVSLAEPGWDDLLDRAGVQALALDRRGQAPLILAVAGSPGWQQVYADPRAVLYVRRYEDRAADHHFPRPAAVES